MCGEHVHLGVMMTATWGSSPHVRGAPFMVCFPLLVDGIIPACAGSTVRVKGLRPHFRDHPRMCGEHATGASMQVDCTGSSPHVRGAPPSVLVPLADRGIIPACAGSTSHRHHLPLFTRDHPRMCGEHQSAPAETVQREGSSPHVRGALRTGLELLVVVGIIPACAGSTPIDGGEMLNVRDHPRMCGEHYHSRMQ